LDSRIKVQSLSNQDACPYIVLSKASSNEIPLKRDHMHACINLSSHANIIILIKNDSGDKCKLGSIFGVQTF
jgi:hypothetical protein